MTHRIFIDGQAGTTGLDIQARLAHRPDLELLEIDASRRKDAEARSELLNDADIVVLCLPDDAAREAVSLIRRPDVRVLDASTAHRTAAGWVYGLPELDAGQGSEIAQARRIANPGCYPTGALLLLRPLVDAGLLTADAALSVHAISGYSGGGRALIERYEQQPDPMAVRPYALGMQHKHLAEMTRYAGLRHPPAFCPMVGHFRQGMLVSIPLHTSMLQQSITSAALAELLRARYAGQPLVRVVDSDATGLLDAGFLDPAALAGSDCIELMVFGSAEHLLLCARLDNLGKGAAGAAVQNINLMLDTAPQSGLHVRFAAAGLADDDRSEHDSTQPDSTDHSSHRKEATP